MTPLRTLFLMALYLSISCQARKIERFKAGKGCGMLVPIVTVKTRPTGDVAVPCTQVQYHENEPDKEALVKLTMQGTMYVLIGSCIQDLRFYFVLSIEIRTFHDNAKIYLTLYSHISEARVQQRTPLKKASIV